MNRIDIAPAPPASGKGQARAAVGKDDGKGGDFKALMLWRLSARGDDGRAPGKTDADHADAAKPARPGKPAVARDKADAAPLPLVNVAEAIAPTETLTVDAGAPNALSAILNAEVAPPADVGEPTERPATDKARSALTKAVAGADRLPQTKEAGSLPSDDDLALALGRAVGTPEAARAEMKDPFAVLSSMLKGDKPVEAGEDSADLVAPKMTVITRETHFAPVARLTPVQQVATAVGTELTAGEAPPPTTSAPAEAPTRHTSGPLRVLHVKLEPEQLGTVVVKMRMVDQSLELELIAQKRETAELLEKDKDALTRVLRASGYAPDVVTVTATTATSDSGQPGRPGAQGQPGQAGQQGGSADNGSASSGDGNNGRSPRQAFAAEEPPHEDAGSGRARGDLYL